MQIALCSRFAAGGFIDLPSIKQRPIKKLLRIMKLTAILLTIACLTAGAIGNTQGITLSLKNTPLEKAFSAIEKQSGYYFTYTKEQLQGTKNVDIEVKNKDVKEVLDLCLKGQPVTYEIMGKSIVIKKEKPQSFAFPSETDVPPINIRGRVVNEKGEPVGNVNVVIKGSKKGTITDYNGEFELKDVDENAILLFSSVNMEPFEIKPNGKTELAISLKTKVTALGTVEIKSVNTGYQTLNKERFIGSVATIDSTLFNRTISTDIISRLEGIAPGLLYRGKNTGGPSFLIRSLSTLGLGGTGSVLIVVDNFPYYDDLNNINPNDVENVTILKDAVAASVWGARAGNGVIVITTKKGKYNQPFQLSVSSSLRVQEKPNLFYYPQMNSSDFIDVEQFLFNKGFYDGALNNTFSWPVISPVVELLAQQRAGKISSTDADAQINALRSLDVRNDFERYVYRAGISRQDFLNFNGGTNNIKYGLSVGVDQNQSNRKDGGGYNRYTINSATSFKPFRILELNLGLGLIQDETKSGGNINYPIQPGGGKNAIYPYAQLADALGNPLAIPRGLRTSFIDTAGGGKLLDWHYRPLDEIRLSNNRIKNQGIRLNIGTNLKITSWLDAAVTFGYTQQKSTIKGLAGQESYFVRDLINQFTTINGTIINRPIPLGGILFLSNSETKTKNIRGQVNFNKNWAGKHNVSGMIAGEAGENESSSYASQFYGYNDDVLSYSTNIDYNTFFPQFVGGGAAQIPSRNTYEEGILSRTVAFLANASYSYLGRYGFYASARKDGANIFGVNTNNKWKPLWSAGASWDISKETFYHISWLPDLKLRASYGYTGNASITIPAVTTLAGFGNSQYTQFPMSYIGSPPNPDLRWEKVSTLNLGVDFSVIKNRLSGSIEWYRKISKDVISQAPIDPTTGIRSLTFNYANLKGSGVDISLSSKNVNGKSFQWTSTLNFSYAKTIVTEYYGGFMETPISDGINPKKGQDAFGVYSYRWMGLDPATGDPQGYLNKQISKDYNAIFADSFQNQVFHGSSIPLYYGNLINTFSHKGFSISFNITYKFAYYFRKSVLNYNALFTGWNGHIDYSKRWQQPGDELWTSVPSMTYPTDGRRDNFYAGSEINVERGDHIRLENIRIDFPSWENKKANRFPVRNIQFSFIPANLNLFIWKASKSDFDPDYTGFSFKLPPARVWAVALNVKFK